MNIGQVIKVEYPFYVGEYFADLTWVPGCRDLPIYPDDSERVADGMGEMHLEIIDIHKPGKYPERVFYLRRWVDPGGEIFGKTRLRITTTSAFKRITSGYYYKYRILNANERG